MDFNFNSLSQQNFATTSPRYLRPYDIYKVNLTKIEKTELKGTKDPNAVYPVISFEFTSTEDKGIFEDKLFIPTTEQDMQRITLTNSEGHEYSRPSHFENFQFTLMQIVHALNPKGEEKIKSMSSKIKTIDDFIKLVLDNLKGTSDVETNLKLVGKTNANGNTYAILPKACGISRAGELFPINFIGENLFFTNYEISQQKKYQDAKPTNMDKVDNIDEEDDMDLSTIEL